MWSQAPQLGMSALGGPSRAEPPTWKSVTVLTVLLLVFDPRPLAWAEAGMCVTVTVQKHDG